MFNSPYLHILEAHSYYEIGCPVGETGHGEGSRSGALAKEFSHNKPWNRTRSDLKEGHENKDGDYADI